MCCPEHGSKELWCGGIEEAIGDCDYAIDVLGAYMGRFNVLADTIYNGEIGSPCAAKNAIHEILSDLEKELRLIDR